MVIDFKKFEKTQPHIARIDFLLDYRIYLVVFIFLNLIMEPEWAELFVKTPPKKTPTTLNF